MWAEVEDIMSQASSRIVQHVAEFVPGALALLTLLVGAAVISVLARVLVLRLLTSIDFDRRAEQWGLGVLTRWPSGRSPSIVVARSAQWTILVLGLLLALTALDAAVPSRFTVSMFEYAPNVVAAAIVLALGAMFAQFLGRAVLISAVNMQIQSARALSLSARWLVLIVAASMAIEQLKVGRQILVLTFGILFGGVVLAASLAIGLGARDAVGRAIERELRKPPQPKDQVDRVEHV
jgi:mechanosensitive ion channel-like protein